MDIRLPKPFQNLGEFFSALAVIVIGVLIALGIDQGIAASHGNGEAAQARARIDPEMRIGLGFLAERTLVARCIGQRLDLLEAKLLASNGRWTPVAPAGTAGLEAGNVLPVPLRDWDTSAWSNAQADGAMAHLDPGLRAFYARLYGDFARAATLNEAEYEAGAALNALTKPVTLSSDAVVDLIERIEAERARNRAMTLIAFEAFRVWHAAGNDPKEVLKAMRKNSPTYKACAASGEAQ